jgi:hypothetical protein
MGNREVPRIEILRLRAQRGFPRATEPKAKEAE